MTLWAVSDEKLTPLPKHRLDSEDRLETWIAQDPSLLGMDVLIIGRQVTTSFGKRIDLLAIDDEGNLVIIELKRDMTSRETVAQVLDYASWVNALSAEAINDIASGYLKKPLADAFKERFETAIPDNINTSHRLLIVASELDDSSERIVQYLSMVCSLDINVVFFNCFQHNGVELVGRSWLMDPEQVVIRKRKKILRPTELTWGQESVPVGTWRDLLEEAVSRGLKEGLPIDKLPMNKKTSDGKFNQLRDGDQPIFLNDGHLQIKGKAGAVQIKNWVARIREELQKPEGFITVETADGKRERL
jgi:hypothetical protein